VFPALGQGMALGGLQPKVEVAQGQFEHQPLRIRLGPGQALQQGQGQGKNQQHRHDQGQPAGGGEIGEAQPGRELFHQPWRPLIAAPRSHIGRKMPRARINTMMPRKTMRMGSICCDRVLSSYSTSR